MEETKRYTVLSDNFRWGAEFKQIPRGEPVELTDEQAAPLLTLRAIEPRDEAAFESAESADGVSQVEQTADLPRAPILLGSDTLPAQVEIAEGMTVPLGDVVARAHAASGLEVDAWNALSAEDRDAALQATIEVLQAEHAATAPPAPAKASRGRKAAQ